MNKQILLLLLAILGMACEQPKEKRYLLPVSSTEPNESQLKQIERKYGMFIHFGINTFHDQEWTDGSKPPSSYQPSAIEAEQWVKTAKDAGMKYIILITKHHEGFCLWDSKYTEYDVANSGNPTNVVEEVAKACKKYDVGLGLYYSLWDRKENGNNYVNGYERSPFRYNLDKDLDQKYNAYMINQLNELMDITQKYTEVVEFWFDGGWAKANHRWPLQEIYQTIKSREPNCQVGVNWTIGSPDDPDFHRVLPHYQQQNFPIRYFPSDFRLGDPWLPGENDPKVFTHEGKPYYMPWESTLCISKRWFFNTQDTTFKSMDELEKLYRIATAQDNILILNCPPNRAGRIRDRDVQILSQLKERLNL